MQAENATSACRFDLPDNLVLVVIVCVDSACAIPAPDEPPHPAAITASTASAASANARPAVVSCDRPLCVVLALPDMLTAPPSQTADLRFESVVRKRRLQLGNDFDQRADRVHRRRRWRVDGVRPRDTRV
jgi:hypothetical protein